MALLPPAGAVNVPLPQGGASSIEGSSANASLLRPTPPCFSRDDVALSGSTARHAAPGGAILGRLTGGVAQDNYKHGTGGENMLI